MRQNTSQRFVIGFVAVLLAFVLLNLLFAHLRSDCGLAAVFGRSGCADDIVRVGFPLQVIERGGFVARSTFDGIALVFDLSLALVLSVLTGRLLIGWPAAAARTNTLT